MSIDASKYTAHTHPGKFEGETAATEYFYEQLLNGDGETIWPADVGDLEDDGMNDEPSAELFHIDAEEADAFGLTVGAWYMIREDSQGFVYGSEHATRELAERKFAQWCGL